ncbi:MAG: histidine kinase, partial [Dictyoglomus turgidum]
SGNQKRVARISVIIGKELGLSQEKIRALAISSLLHDIGKIGIPSQILNKPSSLNPLERRFINIHPEIGYNLLRKIEIISDIAPIVYQHHERINGSGYPKGLKGEEILLEAKIIGVADVFEAMTSHRPYRSALPIDMAIKELVENKGTLYDPDVVDAFLKSLKEGRIIL